MQAPVLVVGKTAKTGFRVDQRLRALGLATRAVSRSTQPAFDWEDATTWRPALAGTRSAYVTFYPDLAVPGADETLAGFLAEAVKAGLEHVVLLSGRGEEGAERGEQLLINSGLSWNVVRASWFMQNFSEGFMVEGILNGELALPAGPIREPFIDVDDIADVAVAALTRPELHNRLFEVSGPRAMTFAESVEEIAEATGYAVNFQQIDIETFLSALEEAGEPEGMRWLLRELFTVVFDGRNSQPASGVEEALGRPATDFSTYLRKVMAAGTWNRSGLLAQS
ncbi:MAG: NmrA family transcriptional regulator [Pseudomonadota bacterium]